MDLLGIALSVIGISLFIYYGVTVQYPDYKFWKDIDNDSKNENT